MSFVHDDPEFADLVRIVARDRGLSLGLVEKDYWVTHTLWALHDQGFEIWFKGGTSLSKGFGLIERFSEDLVATVLRVPSWKSGGSTATATRHAYFQALADAMAIPGAMVEHQLDLDSAARSAEFRVVYPGFHRGDLASVFKPFVLLEVGSARVRPFDPRGHSCPRRPSCHPPRGSRIGAQPRPEINPAVPIELARHLAGHESAQVDSTIKRGSQALVDGMAGSRSPLGTRPCFTRSSHVTHPVGPVTFDGCLASPARYENGRSTMTTKATRPLYDLGQSLWLDNLTA